MSSTDRYSIEVSSAICIHVESAGQGIPLLISNNFFMNSEQWANIRKILSKNYRVITYDLRGQGRSTGGEYDLTAEVFVNDIGRIIEYLDLDRPVLLGLYESTAFCRNFALENPGSIGGLVFVSPIFSVFSDISRSILTKSMIRCLKYGGEDALFDYFYPLFYTPRSIENYGNAGYLALRNSFVSRNSKEQLLSKLNCISEIVFGPDILKDLHAPTLLVCGEYDFLTNSRDLNVMSKIIPGASWKSISMAGHTPHIESPVEFCRCIDEFIEQRIVNNELSYNYG